MDTKVHTQLHQYKDFSVCWQRQTVMLSLAAQHLQGKRQTLQTIYSNTASHQKAISLSRSLHNTPAGACESCLWV